MLSGQSQSSDKKKEEDISQELDAVYQRAAKNEEILTGNNPNEEVHQLFSQLSSVFSEANQTISDIEPLFDFFERKISWVEDRISEIEKEQDEFLESEKLKQKFEESCLKIVSSPKGEEAEVESSTVG